MADDAVKRLAKLCQRCRVGRCAVEDKKDVTIDFEELTNTITQTSCPVVLAIRCRCARIGVDYRRAHFRAKACCIVTHKFLPTPSHSSQSLSGIDFQQGRILSTNDGILDAR